MYIMVILAVALSVEAFSSLPTQRSADDTRIWIVAYTYDVPAGTWSVGQHTYYFSWNLPEPGTSNEATFTILEDASLYNGYVLLRPKIYGIQTRVANECINIDAVHPNQSTRFLAAFLTENEMTYPEARAFFHGFTAWVFWDNGNSAMLVPHEVRPYFAKLWPAYTCTYTAR
jgi:hypothetical protein